MNKQNIQKSEMLPIYEELIKISEPDTLEKDGDNLKAKFYLSDLRNYIEKKEQLKGNMPEKRLVIPFANTFNYISPRDLEEILEWLRDNNYLSKEGIKFRHFFWELFIKI